MKLQEHYKDIDLVFKNKLKFAGNPYALITKEEVTEVVYMLERSSAEIEEELSRHVYDYVVPFSEYGREIFVGQTVYEGDFFVFEKEFDSWVFNKNTFMWEAPVPYPIDGKMHYWEESSLSWKPCPDCEEEISASHRQNLSTKKAKSKRG